MLMVWSLQHLAKIIEKENENYLKMGDGKPPMKADEAHPLLKVDGVGDLNHDPSSKTAVPEWQVTCKERKRFSKFTEFMLVCWMIIALCGIFFLFHALGVGYLNKQQLIIVKCNEAKPASTVYYHQIIPKGSQIPFALYSEYLSHISKKYQHLYFNVIFLIDDVYPPGMRNRKYPSYYSWFNNFKLDNIANEDINDFQRKCHNVNVTVNSLNKFMSKTPLKYKWRYIPQSHLMFYARVFSVWQNGGIGMDLITFNNAYHNGFISDSRFDAILSQHNDGINPEIYTKALNKIDNDEVTALFNMFTGIVNQLFFDNGFFLNKTMPVLSRTHRNKREIHNQVEIATEDVSGNDPKDFNTIDDSLISTTQDSKTEQTELLNVSTTSTVDKCPEKSANMTDISAEKKNTSESHPVVLVYDLSIVSSGLASPILLPKQKPSNVLKSGPHLLSIDTEGTFVAASTKFHPFLGYLSSSVAYFTMHPKFAIQDALLSQCSRIYKEDVYCNNIFVF